MSLLDQIEKLEAENKALKDANAWISVEDRLPDDRYDQLVCYDDGYMMIAGFNGVVWVDRGGCQLNSVAGWKPLVCR